MDNAVAPPQNSRLTPSTATPLATTLVPTLLPAPSGFVARVQALPVRTQATAVLGMLGLLAVLALMFSSARTSDYRVLFPNLSDKDGGQVVDKLTQMNVPYRFAEGGGTIWCPRAAYMNCA